MPPQSVSGARLQGFQALTYGLFPLGKVLSLWYTVFLHIYTSCAFDGGVHSIVTPRRCYCSHSRSLAFKHKSTITLWALLQPVTRPHPSPTKLSFKTLALSSDGLRAERGAPPTCLLSRGREPPLSGFPRAHHLPFVLHHPMQFPHLETGLVYLLTFAESGGSLSGTHKLIPQGSLKFTTGECGAHTLIRRPSLVEGLVYISPILTME